MVCVLRKFTLNQACDKDPSSQDIFDVVGNPLIEFLNSCREIEKYGILSRQKVLTLAYVDDAYLNFVDVNCVSEKWKSK